MPARSRGIDTSTRDFFRWIGLLVTIPVVFYSARPFFTGAWRELRARRPGMDTPVAFAVALVFVASIVRDLRGGAHVHFRSQPACSCSCCWADATRKCARATAPAMSSTHWPGCSPRSRSGSMRTAVVESIGVHELQVGDCVVVADGATVPADGELTSAECRVDESLLSGESTPLVRRLGDRLIAGSIVADGPAQMRVARVGADTTLSSIVRLVSRAQQQRPRWARYGDRAAAWFVSGLLLVTTITAAAWLAIDPARAFPASLAVLVVALPLRVRARRSGSPGAFARGPGPARRARADAECDRESHPGELFRGSTRPVP